MTVVGDRNGSHDKSLLVQAWLAGHPEVRTERFPAYAPERNPDELVWCWAKYGRLANFAPADTQALRKRLVAVLRQLKRDPGLLYSFIAHTGLPLLM